MPTYLIEREIPGAAELTDDELRGITDDVQRGRRRALQRPYTWRHSYVAGDKIYCVHEAENADDVLEHARCGGFPANLVAEVARGLRQHRPPRDAESEHAALDSADMSGGVLIGREPERARLHGALAAGVRGDGLAGAAQRRGRASARPGWPRASSPATMRASSAGRATPSRLAVRPDHRGASRVPARRAGRPRWAAARCAAGSRCCSPSSARPSRAPTARRWSRRSAAAWSRWSPSGPRPCCSTTCSGPTRRPSSCSPRWRCRCGSSRCSSSPPTAPTSSRARTRCAGCATTCAATARCQEITVEPLTEQETGLLVEQLARRRRRPPRLTAHRCSTAPAARRSSSRS